MTGNMLMDLVIAAVVVSGLLAFFALRRRLSLRRVRDINGGDLPETLDMGVVFNGKSTDTGMLKPLRGVLFAASGGLVFVSTELRRHVVEIPWDRLNGWSVVRQFRGRPLHRAMVALELASDVGGSIELLFAMPRPEFWTSLIDIAIKSREKG